jgi:DNA-binding MarR family transcriptional regulator
MSSDSGGRSVNDLFRQTLNPQLVVFYEALAERLGLNATDLLAVQLIVSEGSTTPGRLAELAGLTTGAITGVLDRLEQAGVVVREADPDDRRRVIVRLVPERVADLASALQPLAHATDELLARYAPTERAAILDYLERTAQAVSAETANLRAISRGGFVGEMYVAPLGSATRGRLTFDSGAPRVSMNVAPFGAGASARIIMETSASRLAFEGAAPDEELVRGTFSRPLPDVRASGGEVAVRYRRQPFTSRSSRLSLNPSIPWSVELKGGVTDLTGSLEEVRLSSLELTGGANHIKLTLPAPHGTVPVRISGVTSSIGFKRPSGVPVELRVRGGISHLRLDDLRRSNVNGDQRFATYGFETSPDRYEIDVLDGASDLRVSTF